MTKIKSRLVKVLPPTLTMHLQAADHYLNGEPEIRLLRYLVPSNKHAVDVGANIGTYSYFLRRYAEAVHAYEPNPTLAARLMRLMPDVDVQQVALSDTPRREMVLAVPIDASGRPLHELGSVAQSFVGPTERYTVACVTLDSYTFNAIGFIKIDVEQHEREVLRGAIETIRRCRPVVLVEVCPLKYERGVPDEFHFVLREDYCGWFNYAKRWYPFRSFSPGVHALRANFGQRDRYMGKNIMFFPNEHQRAERGPI